MKLSIKIDLDNAAFEADGQTARFRNGAEPARILRRLAAGMAEDTLEAGEAYSLFDINGHKVGEAKVTR